MSDYIAASIGLTTTPVVVLAAAEFDRQVGLSPEADTVFISFDGTDYARIAQGTGGAPNRETRFVLPTAKDLYAKTASGTTALNLIVSVAGLGE